MGREPINLSLCANDQRKMGKTGCFKSGLDISVAKEAKRW